MTKDDAFFFVVPPLLLAVFEAFKPLADFLFNLLWVLW